MSPLALVWVVSALAGVALFASGWLFGRATGRRAAAAAAGRGVPAPQGLAPAAGEAAQRQATELSRPAARPSSAPPAVREASPPAPASGEAAPASPAPARQGAGEPSPPVNPLGTIDLDLSDLTEEEDFAASTVDEEPADVDPADDVTRVIEASAEPSRPALPPLAPSPTAPAPTTSPRRPSTTRRPTIPVNLSAEEFREGELARLLGELEADGIKRQLVLADEVGLPVAAWRAEGTADVMAAMAAYTSEVGERFESLLAVGRARAVTIVCDDCFLEVRPFAAGDERYHVAALGPALPSPNLFLGIQARLVQALARHQGDAL